MVGAAETREEKVVASKVAVVKNEGIAKEQKE